MANSLYDLMKQANQPNQPQYQQQDQPQQSDADIGMIQNMLRQRLQNTKTTGADLAKSIAMGNESGSYVPVQNVTDARISESLNNLMKIKEMQAKIASDSRGGNLPAAIQIANEYARARQSGDIQRMNDLALASKSFDKGVLYDVTGNGVTSISGYADTVGSISGAKKSAETIAKEKAELQVKKMAGLAGSTQRAQDTVNLVERMIGNPAKGIVEHPGMRDVVGRANILSGAANRYNPLANNDPVTGMPFPIEGTDAANFTELFKQTRGKQFLEAFETLKGGGQITEIEGQKATQAISRMSLAQSEEEYIQAAQEFIDIVNRGIQTAQRQAQGDYSINGDDANFDAAYDALPSGTVFIDPEGNERIKP